MSIFSQRLKWLREKHKLSQQEMADKLNLSQSYYGRFERGQSEPNIETIIKIQGIFDESLDFIFGITDFDKKGTDLLEKYKNTQSMLQEASTQFTSILTDESIKKTFGNDYNPLIERIRKMINELTVEIQYDRTHLSAHLSSIPGVKEETLKKFEE